MVNNNNIDNVDTSKPSVVRVWTRVGWRLGLFCRKGHTNLYAMYYELNKGVVMIKKPLDMYRHISPVKYGMLQHSIDHYNGLNNVKSEDHEEVNNELLRVQRLLDNGGIDIGSKTNV